jgi:nitrogenase molybdenum-iron protein NifN
MTAARRAGKTSPFASTRNACKLCTPLGACLAMRGVEGCVPYLHGSQGCATYIRRYMINHYKEPVDIASSSFNEQAAIFGGSETFAIGLNNVIAAYAPRMVGVATTCLSETIGDDVRMFLHEYLADHRDDELPEIFTVSTPSYAGTHAEGYLATLRALVEQIAEGGEPTASVNVLTGMVSSADLRHLREILTDVGLGEAMLLPDYSETLDGPAWDEYHRVPAGGTPIDAIRAAGRARATIELGQCMPDTLSAAALLEEKHAVPRVSLPWPMGVRACDAFFDALAELTEQPTPEKYVARRGRLLDAYVDGHKYVCEARAGVFGEEDLVVGIVALLAEIGITPVLCVSGGKSRLLHSRLAEAAPEMIDRMTVHDGTDFAEMEELAAEMDLDVLVGSSKGYTMARSLEIPLVRVGFPIHDRLGGQRIRHVGYRGTQELFDRIANTLIQAKQDGCPVGYTYM